MLVSPKDLWALGLGDVDSEQMVVKWMSEFSRKTPIFTKGPLCLESYIEAIVLGSYSESILKQ